MDEESRSAIFTRKRPHDERPKDGNNGSGLLDAKPQKRIKGTGKAGQNDVADFVPNGGSFSTLEVAEDPEQGNEMMSISSGSDNVSEQVQCHISRHLPAEEQNVDARSTKDPVLGSNNILLFNNNVKAASSFLAIPHLKDIQPGPIMGRNDKLPVKENKAYCKCKRFVLMDKHDRRVLICWHMTLLLIVFLHQGSREHLTQSKWLVSGSRKPKKGPRKILSGALYTKRRST